MAKKGSKATMQVAQYDMTGEQLFRFLDRMTTIQQPVMIWGPPGIGKSHIAEQVARAQQAGYVDISAVTMEPVDVRGVPFVTGRETKSEAQTRWAAPDFLPPSNSQGRHILCFDDLTSAPPATQAALYQLVQFRRCGSYRLPAGASIIAAGNRESDRGVAYKMGSALRSRFVHAYARVDKESWVNHALRNGFAPQVVFFIEHRPELLYTFDPARQTAETDQAFASPRTWEFVSNVLESESVDPDLLIFVLRGALGEGPAIEFSAFLDMWGKLPHPQTIFDDPEGAAIPDDPIVQIALAGALYQAVTDITMDALVIFAKRLRPEIGQFIFTSALKRDASLQYTRAFGAWQAHRAAA